MEEEKTGEKPEKKKEESRVDMKEKKNEHGGK